MPGRYLMVLPVSAARTGEHTFAIESAFAEHLRLLKERLGSLAETLVIASPAMSAERHARSQGQLATIDEREDRIVYRPMFPDSIGRLAYVKAFPRILKALDREIAAADFVHAGNSALYRPFEFPALMIASLRGAKTISVTDIDHRTTARMNYETRLWGLRAYLVTKLLHETYAHVQQSIAVRRFSLVLLKGKQLTADYGAGRSNVRYFLDSAFSAKQVIPRARLNEKIARFANEDALRVVYFGRLVGYKGVDHMLRAVAHAVTCGARVRFDVIGTGPEEKSLHELSSQLGIGDHVAFHGAIPFGPELFERLYPAHVLLAAPLSQDTPRSALDACAAGLAILAYDTYYYRELAELGAPVTVVPWLDWTGLGAKLAELSASREPLADMARQAERFARDNTQEIWLERRVEWTRQLASAPSAGP